MGISVETIAYEVLSRSGTTLYGLVGSRVYFGLAPASHKNADACVVMRPDGGDGQMYGSPVKSRSYLVECWGGDGDGASWAGAEAIYRAVIDAWHDVGKIETAGGVMLQGWEEMAGVPLVHPDTKQRYYVCRVGGKFRGA